jgi:predicted nucleic acid-binding protein
VSESQAEPTPQEVVDELRKIQVGDVLISSASMFASVAYGKLTPDLRDLEQARLAIEALRALLPVLEDTVGEELIRDFKQVTANLQLAYAEAAKGAV